MGTAALSAIRRDNTLAIIGALDEHHELSRAQLCTATALSRTTTHRILTELIESGVVVERAVSPSGPGRPEGLLALNPGAYAVMGIELGRAQATAVLLNWAGEVAWSRQVNFEIVLEWDAALGALESFLDESVGADDISQLRHAVVGMHGLMPSSRDHMGSQERDRRVAELRHRLEQRLGVPVVVAGNTRLAGLAEYRARSLSHEDLVYCHLSRGVGAAILLKGKLWAGSTNSAGEFGHIRIMDDGIACHCGSHGCLETVISVDRVLEQARQLRPDLRDFSHLCRVAAWDPAMRALAESTAHTLGRALGNLSNILNPEHIVLGGELVRLTDDWVSLVVEGLEDTALPQVSKSLRLSPSLYNRLAAAHGAGLLALDHILGREKILEGDQTP